LRVLSVFNAAAAVGGVIFLFNPQLNNAQQKGSNAAKQQRCLQYDTPGVQLTGTLRTRKVFGPPGYGETPARDQRTTILILKFKHSVCVDPTADAETARSANLDHADNVREMQLFMNESQAAIARRLNGRAVAVNGTLNESITAGQYTKVWLDAKSFALE
jgi:hypothetical protein